MRHDQHFISKRLKMDNNKAKQNDPDYSYEMAIDLEFPYAENQTRDNQLKEESY